MKQINEVIVLTTIIFDENTFVSAVDLFDFEFLGDNLLSITNYSAVWDSRKDSVYLLSARSLDYFLDNTNVFSLNIIVANVIISFICFIIHYLRFINL